jgi:hypothetical protein
LGPLQHNRAEKIVRLHASVKYELVDQCRLSLRSDSCNAGGLVYDGEGVLIFTRCVVLVLKPVRCVYNVPEGYRLGTAN